MAEAHFPNTFATERYQLGLHDLAPKYSMPLAELGRKGYVVEVGLMREDVAAITEIAGQTGVREYCRRDLDERWTDEASAEKQLAKDTGRGAFLLRKIANNAISGFGWTGLAGADERAITQYEHTFAVRLHQDTQGQGLATPFSQVIVAGSMSVFRARRIGLETWASNGAAVNAYLRAGAQLVRAVSGQLRPTLDETKPLNDKGQHVTEDTRLYMRYPWSA